MDIPQEKIDNLHKVSKRLLEIGVCCLMALGFSMLLEPLLAVLGVAIKAWACYPAICLVYKILGAIFGIVTILSLIPTMILSMWATDDQKQRRKEEIKEAVMELSEGMTGLRHSVVPEIELYDPFVEDTPLEQKKAVEKLLRDLPSHREKRNCINMSEESRYLTALRDLKILSSSKCGNVNDLRTWVEQVTGKQAPEQYRFNDAFPSTNKAGIKKAKERIKQILEI